MATPMLAVTLPSLGSVSLMLLIALGMFWVTEFVQLMLLGDSAFPGRFDKVLWGAAFMIVIPFAPFAFYLWKSARLAELSAAQPAA